MCAYDVALSAMLSVLRVVPLPILAEPVGTKSESKRIFAEADVNELTSIYDLFNHSMQIWRSQQSRPAISLAELEEREEAEEGEREGAEGGDGTEEKGGYRTAHRDFVERIKENQGKLEEAIAPLVVEAFGLSRLSVQFFSIRWYPTGEQENRRAEEEAADGSLGMTSDGSTAEVGKDVEQVEMSANGLGMNEESGREGSSIDLEKEEKEKEKEKKKKLLKLINESAHGSWQDYLVTMTVTGALVELCAERELIVGKPVVEGMTQPDRTMSITFIGERLFVRREKRRELCGGVYLASDRA
ncbi:uncharacterized protein MONOS_8006 [Monocercomonoides exilis]|uniref:uncharacterized protein n=1 Tax=Monocercomonoides exilis TaxID=2049356 RepID=UPI00355A4BD3|nr:hypothetical protein MONOS_8006 [Monocercomonoides exilis]|eukprot:MONOS_8006.1-p1 / transcript=MONOS_8006.1 / gene=MONOS_8006 / organism=Monocercomonoides_exilis_PA203 / gene_product=unspecified product / transcript_product=unspecified product / location=Mono_scaffold00290:52048-53260(+) / protein_length=300 / sequence_SO=supercontig / SO=protein_coding / is_pseudo=false